MISGEEYIRRAYGCVTGLIEGNKQPIRANGEKGFAWKKPEAYQVVTTKDGEKTFLVGANDHLGWDAAVLYEASKLFYDNLKQLDM